MTIRTVDPRDAERLLEIYAPYVLNTAVSFETEVPSVAEFERRIAHVREMYPYIAAEEDGEILGYAYASRFSARAAYDWAVDTSIYVREGAHRRGIGRALYGELERLLTAQGVLYMSVGIAYTDSPDARLSRDSFEFHKRLGWRYVGTFGKCGYKFGKWYDLVRMEKHIGEQTENPKPVRAITKGD